MIEKQRKMKSQSKYTQLCVPCFFLTTTAFSDMSDCWKVSNPKHSADTTTRARTS